MFTTRVRVGTKPDGTTWAQSGHDGHQARTKRVPTEVGELVPQVVLPEGPAVVGMEHNECLPHHVVAHRGLDGWTGHGDACAVNSVAFREGFVTA